MRGQRVMLDFDLASLYQVETHALNQAVKRNIERFPEDFMFQLTRGEWEILKSQIVTAKSIAKQRFQPDAFTENGVAMPSSVLRSPLAIQVNIGFMRAFTEFRRMAASLPPANPAADIAQLRKDFEDLKLDIKEILHGQNDINESTRIQLDTISTALAKLQYDKYDKREQKPRRKIGFIQN